MRTRNDKPIGVVIHICMETTQGNSLCNYLYLKLAKTSCLSFYLLCFFSTKLEDRSVELWGKGRRINTVQIMCTDVCRCKNDTS
jgi:hypothetical protein